MEDMSAMLYLKADRIKVKVSKVFSFIIIVIALLITLFPIYWMLATSFKTQFEIYLAEPTVFPQKFTFEGYKLLLTKTKFIKGLGNSFFVAMSVAGITILLSVPCSYAISKLNFRGKRLLSSSILFTYLIPASVLYIPMYMMLVKIGMTNDIKGLMLIYPTMTIPYATWILIPYFNSIPVELEEAARVDGYTRIMSMLYIVVPLAKPGIITTFIFSFNMCWGEFLYALVTLRKGNCKTFPLIISGLIWGDLYPWAQIMAGGIIACIPIIIVYISASKFLISGLMSGGLKM
jgi:multiple sugar transport system permease protein